MGLRNRIIIGVKSLGLGPLVWGGWSYSMIPVDGMQIILIEFGYSRAAYVLGQVVALGFWKVKDREVGAYFGTLYRENCITCSSFFVLNTLSLHPAHYALFA